MLVQQAIERDEAAFAALYDLHVDRVYKHVYYHVSNCADAEDITQEVFVRAWKAIGRYKSTKAPFVAWLIAIARNLVRDHYRAKKNPIPLDEAGAVQFSGKTPHAIAELNLDKSHVREAISKLKGDKQKVIFMRFIDDFSYEEIAKVLGKSQGTIRVMLYRALKDLKGILSESGLNLY